MLMLDSKTFTGLSSGILSMRKNVMAVRKTILRNRTNDKRLKVKSGLVDKKLENDKIKNEKEKQSEQKKNLRQKLRSPSSNIFKKPELAFKIPGISALGAVITFFSITLLGWMLKALPKLKKAVEDFIEKAKKFIESLKIFWDVLKSGFALLFNVVEDIFKGLGFGGTDGLNEGDDKKTQKLIDDLVKSLKTLQEQLPQRFQQFSLDLAKAFGRVQKGESPGVAGVSGSGDVSGVTGDAEAYRVAAAISTEAGRGQAAADVMQVVANRVSDSRYPNNYTDVLAAPGQFEGVFKRDLNQFRRIKTLEDAARWAGTTTSVIQGYLSDLKNPTYVAKSKEVRGALEFRGAPGLIKQQNLARPGTHAAGPSGRFSDSTWRGTSADNQFLFGSQDPTRVGGAADYSLGIKGAGGIAKVKYPTAAEIESQAMERREGLIEDLNTGGPKKISIDKDVIVPIQLNKSTKEEYQQAFAAADSISITSVDGDSVYEDLIGG